MLNRRGYSSLSCAGECGTVDTCPNCDISLTPHGYQGDELSLWFFWKFPCLSNCQSRSIRYYGTGLRRYDNGWTLSRRHAFYAWMWIQLTMLVTKPCLTSLEKGEADILLVPRWLPRIGFSNVTLVGVLNADTALNLPDFRSSERTFQLLTQVAGRSRTSWKGRSRYWFNPTILIIIFVLQGSRTTKVSTPMKWVSDVSWVTHLIISLLGLPCLIRRRRGS